MKKFFYLFLILSVYSFQATGQIQIKQSFDSISISDRSHIEVLPDQSWVVSANSTSGGFSTLYYNDCGELQWAKKWQVGLPNSLVLRDMITTRQGNIAFTGHTAFFEMGDPFLLIVNPDGEVLTFEIYYSDLIEYVYSISETPDENLMIYGNQTNLGGPGGNYVLLVDQQGSIIWAKDYFPNQIWGAGIACQDRGFLIRSGNIIYKLDQNGNIQWANNYSGIHASSKPIEVDNGFVFNRVSYGGNNFNFFFKLDYDGNLAWITDNYDSFSFPEIIQLPNKNILAISTGNIPNQQSQTISLIELSSEGELISQRAIQGGRGDAISGFQDGSIILSGLDSNRLFFLTSDTTLQFVCSPSTGYQNTFPAVQIDQSPLSTTPSDIFFEPLDSTIYSEDIIINTNPSCLQLDFDFPEFGPDTTLCTGDSLWLNATLEGATYLWQDGSTEPWFLVKETGTYMVDISKCGQTKTLSIDIQTELCPCKLGMPTAFTPNGDDLNDWFGLIADCNVIKNYRLQLFNRWGEEVFFSLEAGNGWDGTFNGFPMPADTYIYLLEYEYDEGTGIQSVKEHGSFLLVR